jgi:hypothetical protein
MRIAVSGKLFDCCVEGVHCSVREHMRDPAFPGIHHIGGSDVQKPAKEDRDNYKASQKGRMTFPYREEGSAKPIAKRAPPVRGSHQEAPSPNTDEKKSRMS